MADNRPKTLLSEQAYQRIRDLIITLRLKPGAQVIESDLEKELSIGRTPVREAFLRLVNEGFLNGVQGRGFFVRQLSLEDIKALFETVMILERAVAALAAKRIKSYEMDALKTVNRQLAKAMAKKECLQVTLLNGEFHRTIHQATANSFLIAACNNVESQYDRLAYLCFSDKTNNDDLDAHFAKVLAEHEELIACLEIHDDLTAVETVTKHIHLFHSRVSQYFFPPMGALEVACGALPLSAQIPPLNLQGEKTDEG